MWLFEFFEPLASAFDGQTLRGDCFIEFLGCVVGLHFSTKSRCFQFALKQHVSHAAQLIELLLFVVVPGFEFLKAGLASATTGKQQQEQQSIPHG